MFSSQEKPVWSHKSFGQPSRDALAVLRVAAERCGDQDVRTPDVLAALAYLCDQSTRRYVFGRFQRALDIENSQDRFDAVQAAYAGIVRSRPALVLEDLRSPPLGAESEASQDS